MESKVQNKIKTYMESKGYHVIKVIQLSLNGYPDLMCLKDGQTIWIEVKDKGEKPRPLQEYRIKELNELGFKAFFADSIDSLIYNFNK